MTILPPVWDILASILAGFILLFALVAYIVGCDKASKLLDDE